MLANVPREVTLACEELTACAASTCHNSREIRTVCKKKHPVKCKPSNGYLINLISPSAHALKKKLLLLIQYSAISDVLEG